MYAYEWSGIVNSGLLDYCICGNDPRFDLLAQSTLKNMHSIHHFLYYNVHLSHGQAATTLTLGLRTCIFKLSWFMRSIPLN